MNVRSNPASSPSLSCDRFRALRKCCSALPNAFSGPDDGWMCFRRDCSNHSMLISYGR